MLAAASSPLANPFTCHYKIMPYILQGESVMPALVPHRAKQLAETFKCHIIQKLWISIGLMHI